MHRFNVVRRERVREHADLHALAGEPRQHLRTPVVDRAVRLTSGAGVGSARCQGSTEERSNDAKMP
jgi:hypothetical protein